MTTADQQFTMKGMAYHIHGNTPYYTAGDPKTCRTIFNRNKTLIQFPGHFDTTNGKMQLQRYETWILW